MDASERVFDLNATEPRSPEFMEGYCAYRRGDTLMHCPFGMVTVSDRCGMPLGKCEKYEGWYAAWEDYQDRLRQFGE